MLFKDIVNKKKQEAVEIMEKQREHNRKVRYAERTAVVAKQDLNAVMKFHKPEIERHLGPVEKVNDNCWIITDQHSRHKDKYEIFIYESNIDKTFMPRLYRKSPHGLKQCHGSFDAKKSESNIQMIQQCLQDLAEVLIDPDRYIAI